MFGCLCAFLQIRSDVAVYIVPLHYPISTFWATKQMKLFVKAIRHSAIDTDLWFKDWCRMNVMQLICYCLLRCYNIAKYRCFTMSYRCLKDRKWKTLLITNSYQLRGLAGMVGLGECANKAVFVYLCHMLILHNSDYTVCNPLVTLDCSWQLPTLGPWMLVGRDKKGLWVVR